ncbi:MAG: hypothetical protein NTU49_00015, partial [Gammaproteobacteria bacterium]|nr:hypothetical protein [Gammaproteobacteria bacterium]
MQFESTYQSQKPFRNFWILPLFILAAGLDVRLSDLGARGPNVNLLELISVLGLLKLLLDALVMPKQFPIMLGNLWRGQPFVVGYYAWIFLAALIGLSVYPKSIFIVRNIFPAFIFAYFFVSNVKTTKDLKFLLVVYCLSTLPNMILGVSQYLFGTPYLVILNMASAVKMDLDGSFVRNVAGGLYTHPNGLSIFMMPVVVAAFSQTFRTGSKFIYKILYFLMFLMSAF